MSKINYYVLQYDNFYNSRDIVALKDIDKMLVQHRELELKGEYSLFSCNNIEDYVC